MRSRGVSIMGARIMSVALLRPKSCAYMVSVN